MKAICIKLNLVILALSCISNSVGGKGSETLFPDYAINPQSAVKTSTFSSSILAGEEIDLLINWVKPSSGIVKTNDYLQLQYQVQNDGNISTQNTNIGFYLSRDLTLSEEDYLLGKGTIFQINPNQSGNFSKLIWINENPDMEDGMYYLLAVADSDNSIDETNEENNIYATQIVYLNAEDPYTEEKNLTLQDIQMRKDSVQNGDYLYVYFTISSLTTQYNVDATVYISTDTLLSVEEDVFAGRQSISSVYSGTSEYSYPYAFEIDGFDVSDTGSYYVFGVLDYEDKIDETNENDNVVFDSIYFKNQGQPDVYIESIEISKDSILSTDSFVISCYTGNSGYQYVESVAVDYYLSEDMVYDESDRHLGDDETNYILSGEIVEEKLYIENETFVPGDFFIICVADKDGLITGDINTNNNYLSVPIKIINSQSLAAIDINLHTLNTPDTLYINERDTLTFAFDYVDTDEALINFRGYMSTDSVFGEDDLEHQFLASGVLAEPNQTTFFTSIFKAYQRDSNSKQYLILKVDDANQVFEVDESNNVLIVPVVFATRPVRIDYIANRIRLTLPVIQSNDSIEGSVSYYNTGTFYPDTVILSAFISNGENFEYSNLIWMDTVSRTGYYSNSDNFSIPVPDTVTSGFKNLFIKMLHTGSFKDIDESNNIAHTQLAIQNSSADYLLADLALNNTEFHQGETAYFEYSVTNTGNGMTIDPGVKIYFSDDPTFSQDDILLKDYILEGTGIYYTRYCTDVIQIPGNINPGSYYLLVILDPEHLISETDELNNELSIPVTVKTSEVNLIVSELVPEKDEIVLNETVQFTYTINNIGSQSSNYFLTGFFLSKDSIYDESDERFAFVTSYLESNGSETKTLGYRADMYQDTGSYFIICQTDYSCTEPESREDDNDAYFEMCISNPDIDLEIIGIEQDTLKLSSGELSIFNLVVRNIGSNGTVEDIDIAHYLSKDTELNMTEDTYISTFEFNSIDALETRDVSFRTYIPENYPDGKYYLHMLIDSSDKFKESNELNNTICIPLQIKNDKDLLMKSIEITTETISGGENMSYSFTVRNGGETSSNRTTTCSLFVSLDTLFSSDDIYLGRDFVSAINGGDELVISGSQYIPQNLIPGNYYILFYIDHEQLIYETNETNNVAYINKDIYGKDIDLSIYNIYFTIGDYVYLKDFQINAGETLGIRSKIINEGSADITTNSYLSYFLSADSLYDASDIELGQSYIPALSASASNDEYKSWTANEIPTGNYFILFIIDKENTVAERDEENNIVAIPVYIYNVYNGIEYCFVDYIENTTIDSVKISFSIMNSGNTNAGSSSTCIIYLSDDQIIDSGDPVLGSYSIDPLNSEEKIPINFNCRRPAESDKFIIIRIDAENSLTEANETNNEKINIALQLPIDITITSTAKATAHPGDGITITSTIDYEGKYVPHSGQIEHYLSDNNTLDEADVFLGREPLILTYQQATINDQSITIPENQANGEYYLITWLHLDTVSVDRDSTNNICTQGISIIPVSVESGIMQSSEIAIYPSPATEYIIVETTEKYNEYRVYSINGACYSNGKIYNKRFEIKTTGLSPGLYLLRIHNDHAVRSIRFEIVD